LSEEPTRRSIADPAAAVAAAALVAVVGTAAAIGTVRDFILDRGFIGLPPQGATPSAPESGELVLEGRTKGPAVEYCSRLATDEAREVADALSVLDRARDTHSLAYLLAEAVESLNPTTIRFEPYLPHGEFPIHAG
jgi:hypothetical protein